MLPNSIATLELTGVEKLFCVHGCWVTICYAAHLTGDRNIIANNIQHVIPHLLKRHPRMRTRLYIEGYQHLLQIFDYDEEFFKANLFYSIVTTNEQSWQKIAEDVCNRNPYSDNGKIIFPLFHFMLIFDENSSSSDDDLFHLLLFNNHCASDGRSGFILMNDFLTLVTSPDLLTRTESVNKQLIPCLTDLTPRPYGPLYPLMVFIAKILFKQEIRKLNHSSVPVKTTFCDGEPTPYHFQPVKAKFTFTSSSSTLYPRLHEKCRSQQITLNGPLLACLLLAIDHCFPSENQDQRYLNRRHVDVDFNMRQRLSSPLLTSNTVGFCVGIAEVKIKKKLPLASTLFWRLAKKCMLATREVIDNKEAYFRQHLIKDVVKNENSFNRLMEECQDGRVAEINFSNIGKYPYSCDYNTGQLRLRGIHITNNGSIYHASVIVFVTCTDDGQLDFSLSHEISTDEKAQEFLNYYVHLIEACADSGINTTLHQLLDSVKL